MGLREAVFNCNYILSRSLIYSQVLLWLHWPLQEDTFRAFLPLVSIHRCGRPFGDHPDILKSFSVIPPWDSCQQVQVLLRTRREQFHAAAGESIPTPRFTTPPKAPTTASAAGSQCGASVANGGRSAGLATATDSPQARLPAGL